MLSLAWHDELTRAIDDLGARGATLDYWWRDDDAVAATPQLARLLALSANTRTPLALAVIPASAEAALPGALAGPAHCRVWQHGYAHCNRARAGNKKSELGDERDAAEVVAELAHGRERLHSLFGERFDDVLVPPWNRIGPVVRSRLGAAGFERISTYASVARDLERQAPGTPGAAGPMVANTHVDPIDWRGSRGFAGEDVVMTRMCEQVRALADAPGARGVALGILTHHLVHDDACWRFLEDLLGWLDSNPRARAIPPEQLFEPR